MVCLPSLFLCTFIVLITAQQISSLIIFDINFKKYFIIHYKELFSWMLCHNKLKGVHRFMYLENK